jgi:hypothetical protein
MTPTAYGSSLPPVLEPYGPVLESVYQTEEEARQELETLFDDPAVVNRWLSGMPLKEAERA